MADVSITSCPHCGQRISSPPPTGMCPGCTLPLTPSPAELQARIDRLSRQHQGAGDRLGLIQKEYGELQRQLDRIASSLKAGRQQLTEQEERDGERLQWETAIEEERRLREQAEAAAAELRIIRAEDLERYLHEHRQHEQSANEQDIRRDLTNIAVPLEARILELEQENAALQAKVREAERTLLDAAGMVGQLTELRGELERLGTRYLHAREEATRLLHEKLDLRGEIDDLAEQLLEKACRERTALQPAVRQAREQIREALRGQDGPLPRPDE